MKALLVNGSPNEKGCTYTALSEVATSLNGEGIETDIFWIGRKPFSGCVACQKCSTLKRCAINDKVNEFRVLAAEYDGYVFGTPVHFAGITGALACFMDRLFFSEVRGDNKNFYLKPSAAVVSARRAGTTTALDQMNKYLSYVQMPVIGSQYWNMVHGNTPEEVAQDLEGLQIMRTLGRNMAFFLKCREIGLKNGVELPKEEDRIRTNFIH